MPHEHDQRPWDGFTDHTESYVDTEGQERCVTCDKWLEPGYYTIEDHHRAELT